MLPPQRAEQRLRPLRLPGVAPQRTQQQRQRRPHGLLGLCRINAELGRDLLQRISLQLGKQLVCERVLVHSWPPRDRALPALKVHELPILSASHDKSHVGPFDGINSNQLP